MSEIKYTSPAGAGGGGLNDVVDDTTPQLGGQLDVNGQCLGDGTLELLCFTEIASAVNEFTMANAASGGSPALTVTGDNTDISMTISGKGTGVVIVDGRTISADGAKLDGIDTINATNSSGSGVVIGNVVFFDSVGDAVKAQADVEATSLGVGFALGTIADAASGDFQTDGIMIATEAEWNAVTETGAGGLTEGAQYFVSEITAGKITVTEPSTIGEFVVQVGVALSSTKLKITDTLPKEVVVASAPVPTITATNSSGSGVVIGNVVFFDSVGDAVKAQADAVGTSLAVGFALATIADAASGDFQVDDIMTATEAEWNAVTEEGAGGLTEGAEYFVSEITAGKITTTAPSAIGEFIVQIGIALTSTKLKITDTLKVAL